MTEDDQNASGDSRVKSVLVAVGNHIDEHRSGMLVDLVFAMAWVTVVSVLFELVDWPQWAYYVTMGAGVVAYFGFFWSLEMARAQQ